MVRLVLESDQLREFPVGEFSDHYVKLQLPPPGASYEVPFDPVEVRERLDKSEWHRQRTYTVRDADPAAGTITIDFVTHGSGLAGPWARNARPGDLVQLVGPGGAYSPDPDADWHLLAGDDAAIPAISVALSRITPDRKTFVILEVEDQQYALDPLKTNSSRDYQDRAVGAIGQRRFAGTELLGPPIGFGPELGKDQLWF